MSKLGVKEKEKNVPGKSKSRVHLELLDKIERIQILNYPVCKRLIGNIQFIITIDS